MHDDRFKFERSSGVNCLLFVFVAAICAFLLTLTLYSWELLK